MKQAIENLIHLMWMKEVIEKRDHHYVRNQLYHMLNLEIDELVPAPKIIYHPSEALEIILDALEKKGRLDGSKVARDLFDAKIMNIFAKKPSDVEKTFDELYQTHPTHATKWYYQYAQSLNYIRMDRVLKNISFHTDTTFGKLDITINLSKPEKDPKSIILAGQVASTSYPKCLLCVENEGFSGNFQRDSRDQHRMISTKLQGEVYYFQYSPYIYYNEHAIVLSEVHRPMIINRKTFENLLLLCDQFEGYFFGSNADLPIVGGSILSHDHYQGGKHEFPIERAEILKEWEKDDLSYACLKWPLSTIRIKGQHIKSLVQAASDTLHAWKHYENERLNIFSHTGDTPHQTITPVARKKDGLYELDLILRNNYINEDYPLGLFHPHEDKWHIKKENIGLIEAMGLAILPARLKHELEDVKDYLLHGRDLFESSLMHQHWADQIKAKFDVKVETIDQLIQDEVGHIFEKVLTDCGVFKQDEEGMNAFIHFIEGELL